MSTANEPIYIVRPEFLSHQQLYRGFALPNIKGMLTAREPGPLSFNGLTANGKAG